MPIETPVCVTGAPAPQFELPDTHGKLWTLTDVMTESGLVVAFICNHCPYVKAVIEDFVADARQLRASGIGVVAIMPNDFDAYPEDSPENMAVFAEKCGFEFPYLLDSSQQVAHAYDAVCTPDFFGFNGAGSLQYRGRLDNLRMDRTAARKPELLDAMIEIKKTGTFTGDQLPSAGCSVKWRPAPTH